MTTAILNYHYGLHELDWVMLMVVIAGIAFNLFAARTR